MSSTNSTYLGVTPGGRHKWVDSPYGRIRKPIEYKPSVLAAIRMPKPGETPRVVDITTSTATSGDNFLMFQSKPKASLKEKLIDWVFKKVGR